MITFTPPPTAPTTSDPTTFAPRADALVAWLDTHVEEEQQLVDELDELVGSAASAVFPATSATSLTVGAGTKSFTTQAGLGYRKGSFAVLARTSAPTSTWMFGQFDAYDPVTGAAAFVVAAGQYAGAGTYTDWTLSLSGPRGSDGNVTKGQAIGLSLIFGD